MTKKTIIALSVCIIIISIVGIIVFYNTRTNLSKNQKDIINDMVSENGEFILEGHLTKFSDKQYILLSWSLEGKIDFEKFVNKRIVAIGDNLGNYKMKVNEIIEISEDI